MRSTASRLPDAAGESGSEVVSHVLVQVVAVAVLLALFQLGWALNARNVAVSAAGEGARRAALAGAHVDDGRARTERVLDASPLSPSDVRVTAAVADDPDGRGRVVLVEVEGPLPVLGTWGPAGTLRASGQATAEPGGALESESGAP